MKMHGIGSVRRKFGVGTLLLGMAASLLVGTSCSTSSRIDGHEYVDLGLPSKTVWATCNIGAKSAKDKGLNDFYWSADIQPIDSVMKHEKKIINGKTCHCYTFMPGSYTMEENSKNLLLYEEDVTTAKWGDKWSTPGYSQWKELVDLCQWKKTKKGFRITSRKNGKSIFLPAKDMFYYYRFIADIEYNEGDTLHIMIHFWSGTINPNNDGHQNSLLGSFGPLDYYVSSKRPHKPLPTSCYGVSIRPVAKLPE
jgi:hypothetical protein